MRPTDNKLTCGVHMIGNIVIEKGEYIFIVYSCDDAGHEHFDDVAAYLRQHLFVSLELCLLTAVGRSYELVVLGRHHDGIDAHRLSVVIILNGHLTLGIGAQVGHQLALAANVSQHF